VLELDGCRALHLDGHQADAALFYAQRCRKAGILTSLDGGGLRTNTHELLGHIDVAMVAERFCQQMDKTPEGMLDYLKSRGVKIGGVTQGERGILWYDEGGGVRRLAAPTVPAARVRDTSGAGDVFHGSYIFSYLKNPRQSWEEHFQFAQYAAAHKIQHLGNEAGLPTFGDVKAVAQEFAQEPEPRPARDKVAAIRSSR
jgi:sugar/nucleoside kinase (ribokinase family)